MENGSASSSEVVTLLQEQNKLLKQLLDLQVKHEKKQEHRDWMAVAIKVVPLIVGIILLIWIYVSMSAVLTDIQKQVTEIQTDVGSVFTLIKDQYDLLKTFFSGLLTALKSLVPDFSGIGETLKGLLPQ
ncbi:hypothetical protein IT413_04935 [Candidatus Peregrinibacteria bacterium]|nr:hypothetical protein [Candidatus Peregrinibacteria bacterium]